MESNVQRQVSEEGAGPTGNAAEVRDLKRSFGDLRVLNRIDLDIISGEFVALLGPSGCGKSTLLRVLAGLDREISGQVRVATRRAVVFQQPRLLPWKKVWRNVVLGLPHNHTSNGRELAETVLAEVGLSHRADVWPKVLSGGEAQRVALARALVREPGLLLLDEPFAALDALTRIKAQDLVSELLARHRPSVLMVTHDVDEALRLADRVLVMSPGHIDHNIPVDLDSRDSTSEDYIALRTRLLGTLGVHT